MKVNLLLNNPAGLRNGYTNIDAFASKDDSRILGNITNFTDEVGNEIVCDGEAEEIVANEILEYFSYGEIEYTLNIWIKKLSLEGILTISAIDFEEVARAITFGNLHNAVQLNELLHGKPEDKLVKRAILCVSILRELLEKRGLHILKVLNENFRCIIVAQKSKI